MAAKVSLGTGSQLIIKGTSFDTKMVFELPTKYSHFVNVMDDNVSYSSPLATLKLSYDLSTSNPTLEVYGAPTGVAGASAVGAQLTWNANTWTSVSDENEKDILEPFENITYKLCKLRTVYGIYKFDTQQKIRPFLIAQDLIKDFPEVVDILHDGKLGVRYTELIPFLVASIKELKDE